MQNIYTKQLPFPCPYNIYLATVNSLAIQRYIFNNYSVNDSHSETVELEYVQ